MDVYRLGVCVLAMSPFRGAVSATPTWRPISKLTNRGKNLATVLIGRLLQGAAGSVGATLVGGTISDIYIPSE